MNDAPIFTILCETKEDLTSVFNALLEYAGPLIIDNTDILYSKNIIMGHVVDNSYGHESSDFEHDLLEYILSNVRIESDKLYATLKVNDGTDQLNYIVNFIDDEITCTNEEYEYYKYKYNRVLELINDILSSEADYANMMDMVDRIILQEMST